MVQTVLFKGHHTNKSVGSIKAGNEQLAAGRPCCLGNPTGEGRESARACGIWRSEREGLGGRAFQRRGVGHRRAWGPPPVRPAGGRGQARWFIVCGCQDWEGRRRAQRGGAGSVMMESTSPPNPIAPLSGWLSEAGFVALDCSFAKTIPTRCVGLVLSCLAIQCFLCWWAHFF